MFIHAMGATSGLVYSQMGRYVAKPDTPFKYTDGDGVSRRARPTRSSASTPRSTRQTQRPVSNGAGNLWIDQVALSTALNASYMADQISLFGLVVGIALLLAGFGFGILAVGGALRNPQGLFGFAATRRRTAEPVCAGRLVTPAPPVRNGGPPRGGLRASGGYSSSRPWASA